MRSAEGVGNYWNISKRHYNSRAQACCDIILRFTLYTFIAFYKSFKAYRLFSILFLYFVLFDAISLHITYE